MRGGIQISLSEVRLSTCERFAFIKPVRCRIAAECGCVPSRLLGAGAYIPTSSACAQGRSQIVSQNSYLMPAGEPVTASSVTSTAAGSANHAGCQYTQVLCRSPSHNWNPSLKPLSGACRNAPLTFSFSIMFSISFLLGLAIFALFLYRRFQKRQQQKLDRAIGEEHGCLPPPHLQNQRPLGVDRLEQIFRADAESRLMELFLFHFRQTGSTLEQCFLGTPAFGTIDPANMEAILSANFKGRSNLIA
jgi:hypothetical protein